MISDSEPVIWKFYTTDAVLDILIAIGGWLLTERLKFRDNSLLARSE